MRTPTNYTVAGQAVLKDARDGFERQLRTPRPLVHGVPQAALFTRGDTMAGHLQAMRRTVRREARVLEEMTRQGPCGIEPAAYQWCVVTTWRWAG